MAVSSVEALYNIQDLTEHGGGRGLEGQVEAGQSSQDAPVQRFRVLEGKRKRKTRFLQSEPVTLHFLQIIQVQNPKEDYQTPAPMWFRSHGV